MKLYSILCCLLVTLLFVAACTPSNQATQQEDTQDTVQEEPMDDMQDDMQETGESEDMMDDMQEEVESASDASAKFKQLFSQMMNAGYTVTYMSNTNANGQATTIEMTMYNDLKNMRMRTDVETSGVQARTYLLDGTLTACTLQSGSWLCFESGQSTDVVYQNNQDIQENLDNYQVTSLPPRTVAGTLTECFRVVKSGEGTVDYCLKGTVPLYVKVEAQADGNTVVSELTATSFKESVSNSDFELPAQAGAMPGFPTGSGMPSFPSGYQ